MAINKVLKIQDQNKEDDTISKYKRLDDKCAEILDIIKNKKYKKTIMSR